MFGILLPNAGASVMWQLKQKEKLSLVLYVAIYVCAATLVFGCSNAKSSFDVNRNNIDQVPTLMENPDSPIPDSEDPSSDKPVIVDLGGIDNVAGAGDDDTNDLPPPPPPAEEPKKEEPIKPTPPVRPTPQPKPEPKPQPKPVPAPKPVVDPKPAPVKPGASAEASRFIKVAFWVVQNEARKIGTPCNFYVSRVLELSGYSDDGFLANDFDIYARKHFSSYKDERFVTHNLESERLRLKRYIWSYPARTPFILQWERPRPKPGHIAIVERIGDQLVVYQASLNRHIARREQTSIDRLLSTSRGANLTVYSEFVAGN
jgi:hypothetical protein